MIETASPHAPGSDEILVDGRWLEPPVPMEKVLDALRHLQRGQHIRFLIHREPVPLYELLTGYGYSCVTHPIEDGCYEVIIASRRP